MPTAVPEEKDPSGHDAVSPQRVESRPRIHKPRLDFAETCWDPERAATRSRAFGEPSPRASGCDPRKLGDGSPSPRVRNPIRRAPLFTMPCRTSRPFQGPGPTYEARPGPVMPVSVTSLVTSRRLRSGPRPRTDPHVPRIAAPSIPPPPVPCRAGDPVPRWLESSLSTIRGFSSELRRA